MPLKRTSWLLLILAQSLLAHSGEPVQPHDLWGAWTFDPGVVIPLVICAFLYYLGIYQSKVIPRVQIVAFTAGLLFARTGADFSAARSRRGPVFGAYASTRDSHADFSAVAGAWASPGSIFVGLTHVVAAKNRSSCQDRACSIYLGHNHAPSYRLDHRTGCALGLARSMLFEKTLTSESVHAAQHISFLFASLLFWWAVFQGGDRRMGYGMSVIYIFTTAVHSTILGALLTLSPNLWYSG